MANTSSTPRRHDDSITPAYLSNQGADLIRQGRYHEAQRTLVNALKFTQLCLSRAHRGSSFTPRLVQVVVLARRSQKRPTRPQGRPSTKRNLRASPTEVSPLTTSNELLLLHEKASERKLQCSKRRSTSHAASKTRAAADPSRLPSCFVFTDPMVLDKDTIVSSDHACLMKLAVIIIYNLALSTHLKGIIRLRNNGNREAYMADLKKALALYKLSCLIQAREEIGLNDDIYVLAHLNNLGHINTLLGKEVLSRRCFQRLFHHLVVYTSQVQGYGERAHVSTVRRRRLQGFHRNTAQFILQDPMLAPAA